MNCKKCGNSSPLNSDYCIICGEKLIDDKNSESNTNAKLVLVIIFLLILFGMVMLYLYMDENNLIPTTENTTTTSKTTTTTESTTTTTTTSTTSSTTSTTTSTTSNIITNPNLPNKVKYGNVEHKDKNYTQYDFDFLSMDENTKVEYKLKDYTLTVEMDKDSNIYYKVNSMKKETAALLSVYYIEASNSLIIFGDRAEYEEVTFLDKNGIKSLIPSNLYIVGHEIEDNKLKIQALKYFNADDKNAEVNYTIDISSPELKKIN